MTKYHNGVYLTEAPFRRTNPYQGINTRNPMQPCYGLSRPTEDEALDNAQPEKRSQPAKQAQSIHNTLDLRSMSQSVYQKPRKVSTVSKVAETIQTIEARRETTKERKARLEHQRQEKQERRIRKQREAEQRKQERIAQYIQTIGSNVQDPNGIFTVAYYWQWLEDEVGHTVPYIEANVNGVQYWIIRQYMLAHIPDWMRVFAMKSA